eukprot:CAMPEP_0196767530 /NCGR_PEP_ID=MMETSP1095-20130614/41720_1 /TAXON_ID=96789 ORGANISM="Chromulina nebulosa, Strain UTEXLB2642" /NCGR_SAMPLE_ID=MMETSP1095 /ASSEMBLY_ACC=CAM_ASM_000446 /LENGTH=250 /DNA_ID=CAMNT_0042135957 /DNA_START=133 /DNA_END=885 /DNA_ORIENTATION=-
MVKNTSNETGTPDSKGISDSISNGVNAGIANLSAIPGVISGKVQEADQKLGVTSKANEVVTSATDAVKDFDERNKITETATKIADDVSFNKMVKNTSNETGTPDNKGISDSISNGVNAGIAKAKEIDEKLKISENLSAIPGVISGKVQEADEKLGVTSKANEVVTSATDAVKDFDERNKITETATKIADDVSEKAKAVDSKYDVSANISSAFTASANAITSGVHILAESISNVTSKPTDNETKPTDGDKK